jgi:PadR family transcriptional regulator, regulatory protein AphA
VSTPRLSHTSYLVLGLVGWLGAVTPYELKQVVSGSLGYFWSFPHSQLYSEPDRLVTLGLLEVDQEDEGRRRKRYSLTGAGRSALAAWLHDPAAGRPEVREPALLKLFFGGLAEGADMGRLAQARLAFYAGELERYQQIEKEIPDGPDQAYPRATLRLGLAWARANLAFWSEIAESEEAGPGAAGSDRG